MAGIDEMLAGLIGGGRSLEADRLPLLQLQLVRLVQLGAIVGARLELVALAWLVARLLTVDSLVAGWNVITATWRLRRLAGQSNRRRRRRLRNLVMLLLLGCFGDHHGVGDGVWSAGVGCGLSELRFWAQTSIRGRNLELKATGVITVLVAVRVELLLAAKLSQLLAHTVDRIRAAALGLFSVHLAASWTGRGHLWTVRILPAERLLLLLVHLAALSGLSRTNLRRARQVSGGQIGLVQMRTSHPEHPEGGRVVAESGARLSMRLESITGQA